MMAAEPSASQAHLSSHQVGLLGPDPPMSRGADREEEQSSDHQPEERPEGFVARMRRAGVTSREGWARVSSAVGRDFWRSRRGALAAIWATIALLSLAAMLYIYSRSWYVLVRYGSDPCDVPLARVLRGCLLLVPTYLARSCVWRVLCKICGRSSAEGDETTACQVMVLGFACFCLAYYAAAEGMELLHAARTCDRTAPTLYYWATYVFPSGMAQFILLHAVAACACAGVAQAVWRVRGHSAKGVDPFVVSLLDTVEPDAGFQCSICLEGYAPGTTAKAMPCCGNCFHLECLQGWLEAHRTCPLCRADLRDTVVSANEEAGSVVLHV
uniref:RING-type domain-containing protein n=1 Tax=Pyrodinium bahamense TaxID=73915 RepID=A0A7S0B855_9DINO|mmetsp:Transcript_52827/g.146416  ORF Transcript_52827/g.146416 Transcript_52827/m.146416 type:complete len:327 (+) Transcript_52827:2-982(+)